MGAGKGMARRGRATRPRLRGRVTRPRLGAQTTLASPSVNNTVAFVEEKWEEFVRNAGTRATRLHDYYLGGSSEDASDDECAKIVSELFNDAVTVGAIVLPSGSAAADFQ